MQPSYQPPQHFKDFKPDHIASLAQRETYTYIAEGTGSTNESSLFNNAKTNTVELFKLQLAIAGLQCEYYTADFTPVTFANTLQGTLALNLPAEAQLATRMQVQVFSIALPYTVENLYVESRTNVTLNNILGLESVAFKDSASVQLEGDFNYFFKVFTPAGEELNAFTLLAPNIMVQLLEDGGDYDFEFSGNKIYFYKTFAVMGGGMIPLKQADYDHMLQFGLQITQSLARAARPATVTDTSNLAQMWQLYGTKNSHLFLTLAMLMFSFMFIALCIFFLPLWPIAFILAVVFFVRYRRLLSKRKRLVREWHKGQ